MKNVIFLFLISFQILAQSKDELIQKAFFVANLIERKFYNLNQDQKQRILSSYNQILTYIEDQDIRHGPPGYNQKVEYEGICWIDDDLDFTPGQFNGGIVRGDFLKLIKDCYERSYAMFGSYSSYTLSDVKAIRLPRRDRLTSAICHIDDDPDFTYGQYIIGRLYAENVTEIKALCLSLAKATYKNRGSAGISDFN